MQTNIYDFRSLEASNEDFCKVKILAQEIKNI